MARVILLLVVLAALLGMSSATFCETYSGTTTNATAQQILLTNIVLRAAAGNSTYGIQGLFSSTGPLYNLFTGRTQYRVGAPDYTVAGTNQNNLVIKLVGYFGALFGCNAAGYPGVQNYDMYAVHQNMSINYAMEAYFNSQLSATLLSFGVSAADVTNVAAPALGYFNRCGAPISGLNNNARVQVCGTSDCPLATSATQSTCNQYYSSGASAQQAISYVSVALLAIVASFALLLQ